MERQPMTQTINTTEARQKWSQLLSKVFRREAQVIVEKGGIPVAAIISAQDLKRFKRLEAERAERFKALEESQAAFADVSDEEAEREVSAAIAQVRAENRGRTARTP